MAKRKQSRASVKTKKRMKKRVKKRVVRKASRPKPKAAPLEPRANGSTALATAAPRARPRCATCWVARAPGSPKWPISVCPVPPGFTITTDVCTYYYGHDKQYPKDLRAQVEKALAQVGRITGKTFGDKSNPLLVSVRSGARASMPGMMDTVLNLGLNDETVEALAKKSGDRRFAYDSYRRFITMYSDVVLGVGHEHFEELLDHHKERQGYSLDTDLVRRRLGRAGRALQEAGQG